MHTDASVSCVFRCGSFLAIQVPCATLGACGVCVCRVRVFTFPAASGVRGGVSCHFPTALFWLLYLVLRLCSGNAVRDEFD